MVMKGIEYKSTGTLFDEYATLLLRKEYSPNDIIEINKRETLLLNALKSRLGSKEDENISKLFNELLEVNRVCWLAQAHPMSTLVEQLSARQWFRKRLPPPWMSLHGCRVPRGLLRPAGRWRKGVRVTKKFLTGQGGRRNL